MAPGTPSTTLNCRGRLLDLAEPRILAVVNLTPDSFSDGGQLGSAQAVVDRVGVLLEEGADAIDLGAVSSRPGAAEVCEGEELDRLSPFPALRRAFPAAIFSVDTFRAPVARALLEAGADIVNDISGGRFDTQMFATCAQYQAPLIAMHSRGRSVSELHADSHYGDVVAEVWGYFVERVGAAQAAGLYDLVLDPGFGFGKDPSTNFRLLRALGHLAELGYPLAIGLSRKRMLRALTGSTDYAATEAPAAALHFQALLAGVRILRVHAVAPTRAVVAAWRAYQDAGV